MKITVAGTGYVGLVTGVSLAEIGHHVTCFDVNQDKIALLNSGDIPIFEPGLADMVRKNLKEKRLSFTSDAEEAYSYPEIIFIAVGTPENKDGSANLVYVQNVSQELGQYIKKDVIVVTKSTVPVGTNKKIKRWIEGGLHRKIDIKIVSNPEFLREGSALFDTFNTDRIIIGSESIKAAQKVEKLFEPFKSPILHTDLESAEMIKYASNAFLATKISFINEIANLCEKVGADIRDVSKGIGMDQRIGSKFLQAGIGYGGSCFPKDTKALVQLAGDVAHRFHLLEAVIGVNNNQPLLLLNKAKELIGTFKGKTIAVIGAAFKPNTDDIREAASIVLIKKLLAEGSIVNLFDPVANRNVEKVLGNSINYFNRIDLAITKADLAIIVTEWDEVLKYPISKYKELMNQPIIVDGRNCYSLEEMNELNLTYASIGRCTVFSQNEK